MGFPGWRKVCDWLDESITASEPGEVSSKQPAIKNCEIPRLADYSSMPDEDFWLKFPKKELPVRAETSLNISAFAEKVNSIREEMTITERMYMYAYLDWKNTTFSDMKRLSSRNRRRIPLKWTVT